MHAFIQLYEEQMHETFFFFFLIIIIFFKNSFFTYCFRKCDFPVWQTLEKECDVKTVKKINAFKLALGKMEEM